jgi:hypothetical protein
VSARILDLARQVERLTVTRHDPHRFYEDRSEIAHELRTVARALPPGGGSGLSTLPRDRRG